MILISPFADENASDHSCSMGCEVLDTEPAEVHVCV